MGQGSLWCLLLEGEGVVVVVGVGGRQAGSCCGVLNAVVCGLRGRGCVDCATILQQLGSAEEELGFGPGGGRRVIGWW